MTRRPTDELYRELQQAYDHFNTRLFEDQLAPVMLTLTRKSRTKGYCVQERFVDVKGESKIHEICLNPEFFAIQPLMQTLSTLVHEMAHQWQFDHGTQGKKGYHDAEWSNKMLEIGLCPSNTGEPGGKRKGEQMTHYIINGGRFHEACNELLSKEFVLSWIDRYPSNTPPGTLVLYPHPDEVDELFQPLRDDLKANGLKKAEIDEEIENRKKEATAVEITRAGDGSVILAVKMLDPDDEVETERVTISSSMKDECAGDATGDFGTAPNDLQYRLQQARSPSMGTVKVIDLDVIRKTTAVAVHPDVILPHPKKRGADGDDAEQKKDKSNRLKYRCTDCDAQVWGRPNLSILCIDRQHPGKQIPMVAVDAGPSTRPKKPVVDLTDPDALATSEGPEYEVDAPRKPQGGDDSPTYQERVSVTVSTVGGSKSPVATCNVLLIDLKKAAKLDTSAHEILMRDVGQIGQLLSSSWQGYDMDDEAEGKSGSDDGDLSMHDRLLVLHDLSIDPTQLINDQCPVILKNLVRQFGTAKSAVYAHEGPTQHLAAIGFKATSMGLMKLDPKGQAWIKKK